MASVILTGTGNVTSDAQGNATSVAPAKPANLVDGQYMLAAVLFRTAGGTITAPAGWSVIGSVNSSNLTFGLYYRKVTTASGEPSTYTWSTSAAASRAIGLIALTTGADASTFVDVVGSLAPFTGTTNVVLPGVTAGTTTPKQLVALAIATGTTTGAPSLAAPPAGMSAVVAGGVTADNGSSATATLWLGQETLTAGVSSGSRTITLSPTAANSAGFMFTINSANVPPSVAPIADQIKAAGATATVTAVPTDVDGTVTAHAWTVDKAPYGTTAPTLTGATSATVTTSALAVGTTILKYIATDNTGLQSTPAYARLLVPAASATPVKASRVKSNGGGWAPGGTATDLVDGVSAAGKWIISPVSPTGSEITFEMEVPATGTHTIAFYADWLEADGSTEATGVTGSFTAQAFRSGVAISDVYSGSNLTGAPVLLTYSLDSDDNVALNTDLTTIDIKLTATQAV